MERLRRRRQIERVYRAGRRAQGPAIVLHARRRESDELPSAGPRLAVVAGKRFRTAVARNRARRVAREASRELLRHASEPWDLVLVVRTEVLGQPHQKLLAELETLMRWANILPEGAAAG
ncbi:MAG: ribonuclease P protein component [Armatimonadota bacterium]